jgi:hypothetical protein
MILQDKLDLTKKKLKKKNRVYELTKLIQVNSIVEGVANKAILCV